MTTCVDERFRLDLVDERLWDGAQPVHLTRKTFQLLRLLVRNPQSLVTKEAIRQALWGEVHVSDGLVKEYVHDLRRVLGDKPVKPIYIETVRGRGYRYLGGIEVDGQARSHVRPQGTGTKLPTLLVLPIENLAGGERWARICRGMGDDLITELSRYPDFAVIARGASPADREAHADLHEIGHDLGASYVLRGSMQASECMLRMNLHLTDTLHGHTIWSERYEGDIADLFAIQGDIVGRIVTALGGFDGHIADAERRRLERKPSDDFEAYELYLLALELEERHQRESALEAFALARRALSLNPKHARTWLVLGWSCFQIWSERWAEDPAFYAAMEREAYAKAAELDPRDPFAVLKLAKVHALEGDLAGARDCVERAVDLGRNQADLLATAATYFAIVIDDPARAVQLIDRSRKLYPIAPDWYFMHRSRVIYFAADFKQAFAAAANAPDLKHVRLFEILSAAQLGRTDKVRRLRTAFTERYPDFDATEYIQWQPISGSRAKALFVDGISKAGLD